MKKLLLSMLSLFAAGALFAQVTTSGLNGTVTDQAGEPLVGATVIAVHTPSGTQYGTVSDIHGRYNMQGLRPGGGYMVTFSYVGYQSVEFTGLTLALGLISSVGGGGLLGIFISILAGLLSTVCNYIEGRAVPTTHTTPDPLTLNALLAEMAEAGCDYAFMEVSSHAAEQHRIAGLTFAGGVFSNLTRDHLDYHGTVQNYLNAKKKFFDALPADAFALTNADDKTGAVMLQNTAARRATYSLQKMADFRGRVIEERLDGMALSLNDKEINVMFTGRFNAYNLTAVYGACCLLGWNPEEVLVNMSRLVPVAGRFQTFHSADGVTAIVDYAHTPDAVVNVLNAIRDVLGSKGSILTVVGAGGNRDKGKRPIMAQEAARLSQRVLLTSDNPRFEEPEAILRDMEAGLAGNPEGLEKTVSITDRRTAIDTAVRQAMPGDGIPIAGKGHEDYQEIRGVKHHFDDREEVRRALAELR